MRGHRAHISVPAAIGLALCLLALSSCDALPWTEDEEMREERESAARATASANGSYQADMVARVAGEICRLDPRSDRADKSREAREEVDEIVPRETQQKALREKQSE